MNPSFAVLVPALRRCVVWSFLGASLVAGEARPEQTPQKSISGTAAARQILRETQVYDPAIRQRAEAEAARKIATGAVQMDAVVVTEDKHHNPAFTGYMNRQRQLHLAAKPSLAGGAEIKGPGPASVGVMPYVDLIPYGPPVARWNLIKMPW